MIFLNATLLALSCVLPQENMDIKLTPERVEQFSLLALKAVQTAYPNKPGHVLSNEKDLLTPAQRHPVFWGAFDWHSAVHSHWLLVRLLKLYPKNKVANDVRSYLNEAFKKDKLIAEANYFDLTFTKSFERMYGWAWLLKLAQELDNFEDSDAKRWRFFLRPLEQKIVSLTKAYLPKLSHPIRSGVHPDTGFALAFILDYAKQINDSELIEMINNKARDFYLKDKEYPMNYEPSGEDFFSSGLNEADLMRRVLDKNDFEKWFESFLPNITTTTNNMMIPVAVKDISDGKLVHLAGLNLSRAWALSGISSVLHEKDPRRTVMEQKAEAHLKAGLEYVFSGDFMGEHWLASFAIYHITKAGINSL